MLHEPPMRRDWFGAVMRNGPLRCGQIALRRPSVLDLAGWNCVPDVVCTVGRGSGKLVSLMGVLRPGTGKLQSGSAGLDLRKATCGPVPTHHKPYKVAVPRHLAGFTRRRRTR
jgi:hypothetical protein